MAKMLRAGMPAFLLSIAGPCLAADYTSDSDAAPGTHQQSTKAPDSTTKESYDKDTKSKDTKDKDVK